MLRSRSRTPRDPAVTWLAILWAAAGAFAATCGWAAVHRWQPVAVLWATEVITFAFGLGTAVFQGRWLGSTLQRSRRRALIAAAAARTSPEFWLDREQHVVLSVRRLTVAGITGAWVILRGPAGAVRRPGYGSVTAGSFEVFTCPCYRIPVERQVITRAFSRGPGGGIVQQDEPDPGLSLVRLILLRRMPRSGPRHATGTQLAGLTAQLENAGPRP